MPTDDEKRAQRHSDQKANAGDITGKPEQQPQSVTLPQSHEHLRGPIEEQRQRISDLDKKIAETPPGKSPQPGPKPEGAPVDYSSNPSPSRNELMQEKAQSEAAFDAQMGSQLSNLGESHREDVQSRIRDYVSGKDKSDQETKQDANSDSFADKQDSFADKINSYRDKRDAEDGSSESPSVGQTPDADTGPDGNSDPKGGSIVEDNSGPNDDSNPEASTKSDTPLTDQYVGDKTSPSTSSPSNDPSPSSTPSSSPSGDRDRD